MCVSGYFIGKVINKNVSLAMTKVNGILLRKSEAGNGWGKLLRPLYFPQRLTCQHMGFFQTN